MSAPGQPVDDPGLVRVGEVSAAPKRNRRVLLVSSVVRCDSVVVRKGGTAQPMVTSGAEQRLVAVPPVIARFKVGDDE